MRVLFMTNIPSPYRVEFFNLLAKRCELTVIYERRNASDREKQWQTSRNDEYKVIYLHGLTYSNDASASFEIIRYLKKEYYDIFVVSGYSSLTQMIAITHLKWHKIPFFLNCDGGLVRSDTEIRYRVKKKMIQRASWYLSTGEACDSFLMHYGAKRDKIKRYPFTSIHKSQIILKTLPQNEKQLYKKSIGCKSELMVLSIGQMIHRKGFDLLIQAFQNMNMGNCELYIVGGDISEECSKLLNGWSGKCPVHVVPFQPKAELAAFYMAADVFAFPTREDIWGLVINEAMSYGLPIITSDHCNAGLELVVNRENGLLVPSEDITELAKAIEYLLHLQNREEYANKSLKIIQKYTYEEMVNVHMTVFNNVLDGKK